MLEIKSLLLTAIFSLIAFAFGYIFAGKFFDGRKQNMTKEFRLFIGVRFADAMLTLSIVAQVIVYLHRNYT